MFVFNGSIASYSLWYKGPWFSMWIPGDNGMITGDEKTGVKSSMKQIKETVGRFRSDLCWGFVSSVGWFGVVSVNS